MQVIGKLLGQVPAWLLWQEGGLTVSAELPSRIYGGHVVVALRGDLDVVDADSAAALVMARGARVIVNLSGLDFIDCYALGALLRVQQAARAAGGDVRLAAPDQLVLRLLDLTGLAGVCVYPSVAAAAVSPAPPAMAAPSSTVTQMMAGDGCGAGCAGG